MFAAVAGISMFTSDVQYGTLNPALIAQPSRTNLAVSKVFVATVFGTAIAVSSQIGGLLGGLTSAAGVGDGATIVDRSLWATAFVAMASMVGLGVGMIARHSAAAISGLLIWWLVVENLIVALAPARLARLLPFVAGNAMVGIEMDSPDNEFANIALTQTQNAVLLAGYATAALIAGTVVLHRTEPR